jgi:hypothetical protein
MSRSIRMTRFLADLSTSKSRVPITPLECRSLTAGTDPGEEVSQMATRKIGRNAETDPFTIVKTAQGKPRTHVVETIKTPNKR